jgi:hypothetical protein
MRAVQLGSPDEQIQSFSFTGNDEVAEIVGGMAEMTLAAVTNAGTEDLFYLVIKVAKDITQRETQAQFLHQLITERFAPREDETISQHFLKSNIIQ